MAFYKTRKVWFIKLFDASNPQVFGIGECAPLPNLSCDLTDNYESILKAECDYFCSEGHLNTERLRLIRPYFSVLKRLFSVLMQPKKMCYSTHLSPVQNVEYPLMD